MKDWTLGRFRFYGGSEFEEGWMFGSCFYGTSGPIDDKVWAGWFVALFVVAAGVEFLKAKRPTSVPFKPLTK